MENVLSRVGSALLRALIQVALTFVAFALWLGVLMWYDDLPQVYSDQREGMEDVANPPPEPEGSPEDVALVMSASSEEELDPFWRRNLPLLL